MTAIWKRLEQTMLAFTGRRVLCKTLIDSARCQTRRSWWRGWQRGFQQCWFSYHSWDWSHSQSRASRCSRLKNSGPPVVVGPRTTTCSVETASWYSFSLAWVGCQKLTKELFILGDLAASLQVASIEDTRRNYTFVYSCFLLFLFIFYFIFFTLNHSHSGAAAQLSSNVSNGQHAYWRQH